MSEAQRALLGGLVLILLGATCFLTVAQPDRNAVTRWLARYWQKPNIPISGRNWILIIGVVHSALGLLFLWQALHAW